jgi:hypothetical protein
MGAQEIHSRIARIQSLRNADIVTIRRLLLAMDERLIDITTQANIGPIDNLYACRGGAAGADGRSMVSVRLPTPGFADSLVDWLASPCDDLLHAS